jgi:hypothetical protein
LLLVVVEVHRLFLLKVMVAVVGLEDLELVLH